MGIRPGFLYVLTHLKSEMGEADLQKVRRVTVWRCHNQHRNQLCNIPALDNADNTNLHTSIRYRLPFRHRKKIGIYES